MQKERKENYINQFISYTETYKKVIIAEAANVGSAQLQSIRKSLRGKAIIVMGKNTMMKKALSQVISKNKKLESLNPLLKGNIGLIFTNGDLKEVRDIVNSNKQDAPAKPGQVSNKVVMIPAQNTGMEPTKTSFFQALNIQTKISKGTVEIVNDAKILDIGSKVTQSEAALLNLLNMKPFSYGLLCKTIYDDGTVYSPDVLDTSNDDMMKILIEGISNIAGISLEANYPTACSVASSLSNGFKNLLSISIGTNYDFGNSGKVKEFLKDPSKFAVKEAPKKVEATKKVEEVKKPEPKKEEPKKEESDGEMGLGLFGDD
jgi:large subunit ribosomal protein LP0